MRKIRNISYITAGFLEFSPVGHAAAESIYPQLDTKIPIEIHNDYLYHSDNQPTELNDLFAVIEPESSLQLPENISVQTGLVLEPTRSAVKDRFVECLFGTFNLSDETSVKALRKWSRHEHEGGSDNQSNHLTLKSVVRHGPWNLSVSTTDRVFDPNPTGQTDIEDTLFQASVGYEFANGMTAGCGYRFSEESGIDSHIVGLLFTYQMETSFLFGSAS